MNRYFIQLGLGLFGATACSLPVLHTLLERGASPLYALFVILALVGAFVAGAARLPVGGERQAPVRPWPEPNYNGRDGNGYQPRREDGAALDFEVANDKGNGNFDVRPRPNPPPRKP